MNAPEQLSVARQPGPGGAAARAVPALLVAMEQRIAALIDESRRHEIEPGLRALVISDAEADALAAGPQAAAAEALPDIEPGSLASELPDWPALAALAQRFALGPFEVDVLLACLVVELERRFERLYAYLNDDIARTRPGVELLLRLLAPRRQHLSLQALLAADAPLLQLSLLQSEDHARGGEQFRIADGVLRFLLGRSGIDTKLQPLLGDEPACDLTRRLWALRPEGPALRAATSTLVPAPGLLRLVHLHGRGGSGRLHLAQAAAHAEGAALLVIDTRRLSAPLAEFEGQLNAALREAHLRSAWLVLLHTDALFAEPDRAAALRGIVRRWVPLALPPLWLLAEGRLPLDEWMPESPALVQGLPELDIETRLRAWSLALSETSEPWPSPVDDAGGRYPELARSLAHKFRSNPAEIAHAARRAATECSPGTTGDTAALRVRALHAAAASTCAPRLQRLAEPVPTVHALGDLVLPQDKLEVLADLVRRVRHRHQVLGQWGFDRLSSRGRGLVALFHGPSGTGKTMAVDAVAHTLGMSLYRIDLAGVVSKYIGETEKNLRAIFDEADRADAVLLFDEADALFGKRSQVKDAHDRYANIEINYLLQRIEGFEGIAVLATNKPKHLDEAFQRRIHVTLEFALPREAERLRLWQRSFPPQAPMAPGVDLGFLARGFELSGGTIRNAAISAAYLAAEAGTPIDQRELLRALRTELTKLGRRVQDSDFGPYQPLLATAAAPALPTTEPHP